MAADGDMQLAAVTKGSIKTLGLVSFAWVGRSVLHGRGLCITLGLGEASMAKGGEGVCRGGDTGRLSIRGIILSIPGAELHLNHELMVSSHKEQGWEEGAPRGTVMMR